MSNTNYDVELNITYDYAYRHYLPQYAISIPKYDSGDNRWRYYAYYHTFISFDTEGEQELHYKYLNESSPAPETVYTDDSHLQQWDSYESTINIVSNGVHSKIYFRNPKRNYVTFTSSNCKYKILPITKQSFEVILNSSGYISSTNATFKCSTVEKNCPVQYSWTSAKVYYKKSTDANYSSVNGTVSGTWSDITVSTNLSLATGYTWNIYIQATADDGTVANTAVGNFATTDGTAIAKCVSPVGTYTNGTVNFIWSHSTEYGTAQYAYDLQYSANNGGSWTTVANHVVSSVNNRTVTINSAGVYLWRVRTYNTLNQAGSWAEASFINNIPATPPSNLNVTTKGRPTASWTSTTQSAYQVQVVLGDDIVYDSGAIYSGQNSHFINQYFDDTRAYTFRVRIYNSLGSESAWTTRGYQQPPVQDVEFNVAQREDGGAVISVAPDDDFVKFYLKRNDVLIGEIQNLSYIDKYAVGITNYSVIGVTSGEQSDIKSKGIKVTYPHACITTLDGAQYWVNKRVNSAFEVQTTNEAGINKVQYIGDSTPTHYFNKMKLKSFTVICFDDNGIMDDLLGKVVFYADNFGNGGYCVVTTYDKTDNFIQNGAGIYANEVTMTLEVTNYDDSIEYPI